MSSKHKFPWQAKEAAKQRWQNQGVVFPATFWSQVAVGTASECWPWRGTIKPDGYGQIGFDKKYELAHRMAYILTYGEIPEGECVLHKCDNRPCCNPLHHFLGSLGDNNKDRAQKGRNACKKGTSNGRAKVNEDDVKAIREMYANGSRTQVQICEDYGLSITGVKKIIYRENWAHI